MYYCLPLILTTIVQIHFIDSRYQPTLLRCLALITFPTILAVYAYRRKSVDLSGAISGKCNLLVSLYSIEFIFYLFINRICNCLYDVNF